MRPQPGTHPDYYLHYIGLVGSGNILDALEENKLLLISTIASIPEASADFAYAEGKWTIKQLLQHIADTERILAVRALRFARRDQQINPSFDEDQYAAAANVAVKGIEDLMDELLAIREATRLLFKPLSDEELLRSGETTVGKTTVIALGYMICGHSTHHLKVLRERYLKGL
jgi:uncharacterized damage-inducible protein DinB